MNPVRRRLVILARWPAPGRCKRRLAAELGARRAAEVQERLTAHVAAEARRACGSSIELLLACTGLGPAAAARWGARLGVTQVACQGEGSLGLRLQRQVVRARRAGIDQLVLIGSDLPELASADLTAAFAALQRQAALVLGPAVDGGYWLLGLTLRPGRLPGAAGGGPDAPARCQKGRHAGPSPRLFSGCGEAIRWGSARVLEQTLRAAASERLATALLAQRADLDRREDLERWR